MKKQDQITKIPNIGSIEDREGLKSTKSATSFWYRKSQKTVMPVNAVEATILVLLTIVAKISGGLISIILSIGLVWWLAGVTIHRGFVRQFNTIVFLIAILGVMTFALIYFFGKK